MVEEIESSTTELSDISLPISSELDGILKLDEQNGMLYIAATEDRTGNTESSLMASSPIECVNSIKEVMEPLQTVSKYSWSLFIPTLDSQHKFWKSVQSKYVNCRMFNHLIYKVGFHFDNSLVHMTMTIVKSFNVKEIDLLVRFFSLKSIFFVQRNRLTNNLKQI